MDHLGVRRQDTTRGPPLRILSLDGGGVRGYSIFILLQELMHRTYVEIHGQAPKRHEIPKPCDHFDLIVGTGTGGLVAIMLGRLRMDIDTCKDVYVRMTRRVFETDKTIAGIPYRSTLFKASKLEEAIRDCVREHTVFDDEGNDTLAAATDMRSPATPDTPSTVFSQGSSVRRSMASDIRSPSLSSIQHRTPLGAGRWGNPNALLYDVRENRTKTAVTAVYKGSAKNAPAALLRSYDARREPSPEYNCSIWEAGRATTAIGLAFKPIQIGQSVFTDEGPGRFNPAPQVLDEAAVNEWPGRDVGVFVSIGTGKRPGGTDSQKHQWFESFLGGAIGDFAEARRRLMTKIEGCEETHRYMVREHLSKRGVNVENYFRLNVEVGVGEFGMNEWNRLTDISTNTRMYLSKPDVQSINHNASVRLAKIHKAKARWDRAVGGSGFDDESSRYSWQESVVSQDAVPPPSNPLAAELPADEGFSETRPNSQIQATPPHTPPAGHAQAYKPAFPYQRVASNGDKFAVLAFDEGQPQGLAGNGGSRHGRPEDLPIPVGSEIGSGQVLPLRPYHRAQSQGAHHDAPPQQSWQQQQQQFEDRRQQQQQQQHQQQSPSVQGQGAAQYQAYASQPPLQGRSAAHPGYPVEGGGFRGGDRPPGPPPPPVPPKTPLPQNMDAGSRHGRTGSGRQALPYPDTDGPPPPVNMARKPEYGAR